MPRLPLGPRLYLDPARKRWVIRDGAAFIRTRFTEEDRDQAEGALERYLRGEMPDANEGERVYFIRAHDRIKIGRATDVERRIAILQAASPVRLRLLWSQIGGAETELAFHRRFKECRLHGEWFEIKGPLEEFLTRYGIR